MNTNIEIIPNSMLQQKDDLLQQPREQAQNKEIINTPFLDIPTQYRIYHHFRINYNHKISLKRKPLRKELKGIAEKLKDKKTSKNESISLKLRQYELRETLASEPFQLLKESHMSMMQELTRRVIQQQQMYNATLVECRANIVKPGENYVVHTNNAELAYQKQANERRTMYNQRKRLETAGFILGTKHNGGLKDFEIVLNGQFLAFFDKSDSLFRPYFDNLTETVKCGLHPLSSENFSAKVKGKEHINTSIMPVKGVCSANSFESLSAEKEHLEKEHTRLKTMPSESEGMESQPTPAVSYFAAEEKSKEGRAALHAWREGQLSSKNFKMATVYTLLMAAKSILWPNKSINWTIWENTATHIYEKWYMALPNDRETVQNTLEKHLKAVEKQRKFIEYQAEQGKTAFTLLPHLFFAFQKDVMIQCKQHNFSTFHAQIVRIDADAKQKQSRKLGQLRYKYLKFYEDQTAKFWNNPTLATFHKCVRQLEEKHPHIGTELSEKFKKEVVTKGGLV